MKNQLLKIFIFMLIGYPVLSQDQGKSQIEVSYGMISNEELGYDIINKVLDLFFPEDREVIKRTGCIFVTYKYFAFERLAFGATTGFNKYSRTDYFRNGNYTSLENKIVTVSGEVNFYYVKRRNISLYSLAGIGLFHRNTETKQAYQQQSQGETNGVALQFTPIGIRYGKSFGGFAEFGAGYKGVINLGVNVKF